MPQVFVRSFGRSGATFGLSGARPSCRWLPSWAAPRQADCAASWNSPLGESFAWRRRAHLTLQRHTPFKCPGLGCVTLHIHFSEPGLLCDDINCSRCAIRKMIAVSQCVHVTISDSLTDALQRLFNQLFPLSYVMMNAHCADFTDTAPAHDGDLLVAAVTALN